MATFTGGWGVGLLKQGEVEKVRERITHSPGASQLRALQSGSAQMSRRQRRAPTCMATSGPLLGPPPGESYWDVTGKTILFVPLFGLLHTSFLLRLLVSFSPRYSQGSTCGCLSRGQGSSVTWGGFRGGFARGWQDFIYTSSSLLTLLHFSSRLSLPGERAGLPSQTFSLGGKEAEKVILHSIPVQYFLN